MSQEFPDEKENGESATVPSKTAKTGKTKKIHVNQHVIRKNSKTGEREPVISVKSGKNISYAHEVVILGPSRIVYRPDMPLPCGAKVWIETDSEIVPIIIQTDEDE